MLYPIGIQTFSDIRRDGYVYVDKTAHIHKLARMYDGYHFCEDTAGIYNPFSILNTFSKMKFGEYWFETGTPSFLVKYLKEGNYNLDNISKNDVSPEELSGVNYADPQRGRLENRVGAQAIPGHC